MSFVIDCVKAPPVAAMKAAGVTGLCRYLSWLDRDSLGKIIHQAEYNSLIANGFDVLLNWEFDARDWMGGATAGGAHGLEAVRQAKMLGHPAGYGIAGSADFDMSPNDWASKGHGYAAAFSTAVRAAGYRAGVYGPWDVLQWCSNANLMDVFWQAGMSTSWSGGRNANPWPGAHLRQRRQVTIGGFDCDFNDIIQTNYGQTGLDMEQGDTIKGYMNRGNNIGDFFADNENLRDEWYAVPGTHSKNPPPTGSRFDLLMQAAQKILGEQPAPAAQVQLTDAQVAALTQGVAAAVVGTHDALNSTDLPVIQTATEAALRDFLSGLAK